MTTAPRFRARLAALAGVAVLLSGCGSDLPTKDEFVEKQRDASTEMLSDLEKAGIDTAKAQEILDEVNGCVFDAISSDEDLLTQAYDEGEDGDEATAASVATKSKKCQDVLTERIVAAGTGAGNG